MKKEINEFGKLFQNKKEYDLIEVWHYLMLNYGYIPFEDFLNMDAIIKDKLIILLNKMNEDNKKQLIKSKRGNRY